jgi:hypothetical protein
LSSSPLIKNIQIKVERTLIQGPPIDLSTLKCQQYLKLHINSKTKLVVLCVDLVGSTNLTLLLTPQE